MNSDDFSPGTFAYDMRRFTTALHEVVRLVLRAVTWLLDRITTVIRRYNR